jgi:hypothetical protein
MIDCGNPISEKSFKSLWITSSADTKQFNVSYKVDGSTDSWKTLTTAPSDVRINTQKLNFPTGTRGRYIQLYISSNQYFNIRGMTLIYEELPLQ